MAKKKAKMRDFSKAKEKAKKALNISAKVLVAIIGIAVTFAFMVVPFLHNKIHAVVAKFLWYPSCLLFVISAIATVFIKPKTPSKYPIFDFLGNLGLVPIVVILSSAFLINYYDTTYSWWWAVFVLVALFLPAFVFAMRNFLKKENECTEEQLNTSLKICWKYVGFYWLMDLFYMAIFNYWTADVRSQTLWLALQFVFGGLAMVYIFYNLTRAFLSNAKKHWWGLLQDFMWGISITVYLIFLIPGETLQNIVLTITAAVYGGMLTLVGVAWTIKDNAEKLKQERKLSIKPYLDVRHRYITDIIDIPTENIIYISLASEIIVTQSTIPDTIKDLLILHRRALEPVEQLDPAVYSLLSSQFWSSNIVLVLEIENCGAGNALGVKMKYNDIELSTLCITTSSPKKVLLILSDELLNDGKEEGVDIRLSYEYTDISSLGRYKQEQRFSFERDTNGKLYIIQFEEDLLTPPVEIQGGH